MVRAEAYRSPADGVHLGAGGAGGVLGAVRFFVAAGFSIRYVMERKRWFEESMLGRRMGFGDMLVFGRWHTRSRS